MEAIVILDDV